MKNNCTYTGETGNISRWCFKSWKEIKLFLSRKRWFFTWTKFTHYWKWVGIDNGGGHAGVINIMEKACIYKPKYCIGGFHLFKNYKVIRKLSFIPVIAPEEKSFSIFLQKLQTYPIYLVGITWKFKVLEKWFAENKMTVR